MIERDVVLRDGDAITLGDTTVRVLETPGHTWGTATYLYDVREGGHVYHALTLGGFGLNVIENARQVEAYIDTVARLRGLVTAQDRPLTVHLVTHPFSNELFERAEAARNRKSGERNPLVDQASIARQLAELEKGARERLEIERKK